MLTKKETKHCYKNFEVKGICRMDLIEYMSKKKAMKITDAQMRYIADKLSDALQEDYWISLEDILEDILKEIK